MGAISYDRENWERQLETQKFMSFASAGLLARFLLPHSAEEELDGFEDAQTAWLSHRWWSCFHCQWRSLRERAETVIGATVNGALVPVQKTNSTHPHQGRRHAAHDIRRSEVYARLLEKSETAPPMATCDPIATRTCGRCCCQKPS